MARVTLRPPPVVRGSVPPADTDRRTHWNALHEILLGVKELAPRHDDADDLEQLPIEPLSGLLQRALAHLQTLERELAGPGIPEADLVEADWDEKGQISPPSNRAITLQDYCFGVAVELRRPLRVLKTPGPGDDRVAAYESGKRKLRRALPVILNAAREAGEFGRLDEEVAAADLESSIAIRRLYGEFRRALRRPSSEEPNAVLEAARYAAGAIAALVSSPSYRDVRVEDRRVLRGLRDRAVLWARSDKSSQAGLRLLGDVWACADLLRGVNRRQDLRAHDEALVASLLGARDIEPTEFWTRVGRLEGLDDVLDTWILRARSAGPSEETRSRVETRLHEIAHTS